MASLRNGNDGHRVCGKRLCGKRQDRPVLVYHVQTIEGMIILVKNLKVKIGWHVSRGK